MNSSTDCINHGPGSPPDTGTDQSKWARCRGQAAERSLKVDGVRLRR